jgi:hypothetical protein
MTTASVISDGEPQRRGAATSWPAKIGPIRNELAGLAIESYGMAAAEQTH